MTDKTKKALGRRAFMRSATLGAAAGATAVGAAVVQPRKAEAATPLPSGDGRGYRETDHVKTYYKLARY